MEPLICLLHDLLDRAAMRWALRPALRHRGVSVSYEELNARTRGVAAGLAALGLSRGDRLVAHLPNRPELVELAVACSRLGAIFVPANPMLKARQLTHMLNDSGARWFVSSNVTAGFIEELRQACPRLSTVITCAALDAGPTTPPSTEIDYGTLATSPESPPPSRAIDLDPFAILYTSGSTGRPKGVVLSHRNVVAGAQCVAHYLRNVPEDRILAALPISFDYGFSQVSTAFVSGACAVLTNYSLPIVLLREVAQEGITALAGVPTMWAQLSTLEWPAGCETLRYLTNSGGALGDPVIRALQVRVPEASIYCMYGLTEAFRSTYLEPQELPRRSGSIGKAVPGQEVFVVRPDGSRCDAGEVGELVHRGSFVTQGYWNEPQLTAERFRALPDARGLSPEIAVWSGDLVRQDREGYLYYVGRRDDLIKTSGHRVSSTEIELVAAEVAGVESSTAFGTPDPVLGQRIVLAVVPSRDDATLIERLRQHCRISLPLHMVPAEIREVSTIPLTPNGKPDRRALAAQLALPASRNTQP